VHGGALLAEEVPGRVVSSGGLWNLIVWVRFDRVNQVWELYGVLDEEDGDIVADQVKVALVGIATLAQPCCLPSPLSETNLQGFITHNRVAKP
jgi:hypothetical protein